MATDRGPTIRLQSGPHDRWAYFEEDFLDCIRAAQLMSRLHGRPIDHPAAWPLTYERPASSNDHTWVWRPGTELPP